MDSSKIRALIVATFAIFAAIYLGIAAATSQLEVLICIVSALVIITCLALGRRVWLLIPFMTTLGLVLPLPGYFSTGIIAQGIVIFFMVFLFLMRRLPCKTRITELEIWCLLLVLCVTQTYLRNPVGVNIFGGATVGGRPYAIFALSVITAAVLSSLVVHPTDLKWWVRLSLIGSLCNFGIGALGKVFPAIGFYLGASFSSDVVQQGFDNRADQGRATRIAFVREISATLALWVASKLSPLRATFNLIWSPLILFTLMAAAFSGFRSQLAVISLTYFVGICYRGGIRGVVVASVIGAMAVSLLAVGNLIVPLPSNIQRALTFLPGTWDQRYKLDAEDSTSWRTEMWIEVLTSDRFIRNKLIGDGLGMSAQDLQKSIDIKMLKKTSAIGITGFDAGRESVMLSGDYHSGPVETVRVIGYFGLCIVLLGMIRLACHAHRQIIRSRNTEWFPTALFIGIPLIWQPVFWVFVYGSFSIGATTLLIGSALVRMLENNLPLPAYQPRSRQPYVLSRQRVSGSVGISD